MVALEHYLFGDWLDLVRNLIWSVIGWARVYMCDVSTGTRPGGIGEGLVGKVEGGSCLCYKYSQCNVGERRNITFKVN